MTPGATRSQKSLSWQPVSNPPSGVVGRDAMRSEVSRHQLSDLPQCRRTGISASFPAIVITL